MFHPLAIEAGFPVKDQTNHLLLLHDCLSIFFHQNQIKKVGEGNVFTILQINAIYILIASTKYTEMQDVNFKFIGFEYDYDICYLYLESDPFAVYNRNYYISVNMFFEVYDDQENVVDLLVKNCEESFIFTSHSAGTEVQTD